MAYCPNCKEDKPDNPRFCPDCGARLEPAPLIEEQKGDTGLDRSARQAQSQSVTVNIPGTPGSPEALPWGDCPLCGRHLRQDGTFRCRRCGQAFICLKHQDEELRICTDCAAEVRRQEQARREAEEKARREAEARRPTWQKIGIEMVLIPAGDFLYGDEKQRIHLPASHLARTPVTNAQYKAFVDAAGHPAPYHWKFGRIPAGKEDHPVVNVSWQDAQAFCAWAGCRLPTEQEWEKGARGADGRAYPWGDRWEPGRCNSREAGIKDTSPVARYPSGASPYGLLDMAGNVWEWCEDWYDSDRDSKVLRGGSWGHESCGVRAADRNGFSPAGRDSVIGLRCAAPAEP